MTTSVLKQTAVPELTAGLEPTAVLEPAVVKKGSHPERNSGRNNMPHGGRQLSSIFDVGCHGDG